MFKDNTSGIVHTCFILSSSSGGLESKTSGRVGREGLHHRLRSGIDDRDRIATVMGDIDKTGDRINRDKSWVRAYIHHLGYKTCDNIDDRNRIVTKSTGDVK